MSCHSSNSCPTALHPLSSSLIFVLVLLLQWRRGTFTNSHAQPRLTAAKSKFLSLRGCSRLSLCVRDRAGKRVSAGIAALKRQVWPTEPDIIRNARDARVFAADDVKVFSIRIQYATSVIPRNRFESPLNLKLTCNLSALNKMIRYRLYC